MRRARAPKSENRISSVYHRRPVRSSGKARGREAFGLLWFAFAALSCGARGGDPASASRSPNSIQHETSPAGTSSTASHSPGEQVGGRWELADAIPSLRRATPRGLSQHLSGELLAEVRVNDQASAYPALGPSRPLATGAVLVEAHFASGSADPSIFFAMVKRPPGFDPEGGDWEYLIVEPSGTIVRRGKLPLCARCHAEAPHNFIFGGPR